MIDYHDYKITPEIGEERVWYQRADGQGVAKSAKTVPAAMRLIDKKRGAEPRTSGAVEPADWKRNRFA